MQKFEKIKTIAEKRIAQQKRQKTVANDFIKGDILIITEKVDGHNASFANGNAYSREHKIEESTNAPLVPFIGLVNKMTEVMDTVISELLNTEHDYQFYGEFMVRNRVVQYKEKVYNSWVMFDIFNKTTNEFLGIKKAIEVANAIKDKVDYETKTKIMTPEVLHHEYEFNTYEELEEYVKQYEKKSKLSQDGTMEGAVVTNTSRNFKANNIDKPLRAKVVNKKFKETQRQVTNEKNHTKEIRELMQYLTQARVTKIVMNLCDIGALQPMSKEYYTTQLEKVVRVIAQDINDETPFKINSTSIKAGEDIYNKIEAKARLTMIDRKNSL